MREHSGNLMRMRMGRRRFALATTASVVMGLPPTRILATAQHTHHQDASTGDADVIWTWTDAGAEVTPEIVAGWNRMSIVNNRSAGTPQTHVLTLRVPEGVTDQQIEDELMADDAPFPDWAREAYYPGIPDGVASGQTFNGYTHYVEGRYLWVDIFAGVSGEFTVGPGIWNRVQPAPQVRVDMIDMDFLGLENPIPAGTLLWEASNRGATWHEIVIMQTPGPMTVEEIQDAMMSDEQWPMDGFALRGGYGIVSPGTSGMIELTLEPGDYAALCMAPDNFAGPPHAIAGMIAPFTVE